jgi:hypothetical protein
VPAPCIHSLAGLQGSRYIFVPTPAGIRKVAVAADAYPDPAGNEDWQARRGINAAGIDVITPELVDALSTKSPRSDDTVSVMLGRGQEALVEQHAYEQERLDAGDVSGFIRAQKAFGSVEHRKFTEFLGSLVPIGQVDPNPNGGFLQWVFGFGNTPIDPAAEAADPASAGRAALYCDFCRDGISIGILPPIGGVVRGVRPRVTRVNIGSSPPALAPVSGWEGENVAIHRVGLGGNEVYSMPEEELRALFPNVTRGRHPQLIERFGLQQYEFQVDIKTGEIAESTERLNGFSWWFREGREGRRFIQVTNGSGHLAKGVAEQDLPGVAAAVRTLAGVGPEVPVKVLSLPTGPRLGWVALPSGATELVDLSRVPVVAY